ncbi:MAG: class I SAM-dependent methyltransferase [Eubacterium sp.]
MTDQKEIWINAWKEAAQRSLYRKVFSEEHRCWDASADYYDVGMGSSNERVTIVMDYLERFGFWKGSRKCVLDIGSGTGSFALPLAERGAAVTALDCSASMNRIVHQKAKEKKVHVAVQTGDFNRIPLETQAYDLVISSMNPGLYHPNSFFKMLTLSKDLIVYVGLYDVPLKRDHKKSLDEILLGHKLTHGGSNHVSYPYHILKAMGYQPRVFPVTCKWCDPEGEVDAVTRLIRHYKTLETVISQENWQEIIRHYVHTHLKNDRFMNEGETTMGVLICALNEEEMLLKMTV